MCCGPPPKGGTNQLKGYHNSIVRDLLRKYHGALDERVYPLGDTHMRLLVGKQKEDSCQPVWDTTESEKRGTLSNIIVKERSVLFKSEEFAKIIYESSPTSWFTLLRARLALASTTTTRSSSCSSSRTSRSSRPITSSLPRRPRSGG